MKIDLTQPLPSGADAADFEASGISQAEVLSWLKPRAKTWAPPAENVKDIPVSQTIKQMKSASQEAEVVEIKRKPMTIPPVKEGPAEYEIEQQRFLADFNDKYAVVNESGKAVVYREVHDVLLDRQTIERISFQDFRGLYMNRKIQVGFNKEGDPIQQEIGKWWLSHPKRRQYLGGVVMDPANRAPEDCWNLWKGYTLQPEPGDWTLMRDHIRDIICGGDLTLYAYVMGWLARMVQQPNTQGEVALVMRGKKGTGKSTLGKWMLKLFGQHAIQITQAKHLVGNFNAHLRDAVFVFADEAFFAGDKANEGSLKALITEQYLTVEAKHQNAVTVANMTHIMMASNSEWVVPASEDERRFCVMEVSDARRGDREYFTRLNHQADNGGLAAMLHSLLEWDISGFSHRAVPQTEALAEQKRMSLDTLHQWWLDVLTRGYVYRSKHGSPIFTEWSEFVTTDLLLSSYLQWCKSTGARHPSTKVHLGMMMKCLYQSSRPRASYPVYEIETLDAGSKQAAVCMPHMPGYIVGDLSAAISAFTEKTGIIIDMGEEEE